MVADSNDHSVVEASELESLPLGHSASVHDVVSVEFAKRAQAWREDHRWESAESVLAFQEGLSVVHEGIERVQEELVLSGVGDVDRTSNSGVVIKVLALEQQHTQIFSVTVVSVPESLLE